MAEFVKVVAEKNRMCAAHNEFCNGCPLDSESRGTSINCPTFIEESPKEAEKIIMDWAEKHPVMTNRMKFKEVFGFDIASLFDVNNCRVAEWFNDEYKEKIANE